MISSKERCEQVPGKIERYSKLNGKPCYTWKHKDYCYNRKAISYDKFALPTHFAQIRLLSSPNASTLLIPTATEMTSAIIVFHLSYTRCLTFLFLCLSALCIELKSDFITSLQQNILHILLHDLSSLTSCAYFLSLVSVNWKVLYITDILIV